MSDTLTATPEQIKKMGNAYVPPKIDQGTNRRAARRRSGLEIVAPYLPKSDLEALVWFAGKLHGSQRPPNVTASYGDQRWNGTPASQQANLSYITEAWRADCGKYVDAAERSISDTVLYTALRKVCLDDWSMEEVGSLTCQSRAIRTLRRHGSETLRRATDRLLAYYRTTADYRQTHPGG